MRHARHTYPNVDARICMRGTRKRVPELRRLRGAWLLLGPKNRYHVAWTNTKRCDAVSSAVHTPSSSSGIGEGTTASIFTCKSAQVQLRDQDQIDVQPAKDQEPWLARLLAIKKMMQTSMGVLET
jgi:hypothetical protein